MVVLEVPMTSLINTGAVAELLGLSPATLRLWRSLGKGPRFVKCGGAVRYRTEDLEEWVASRIVKPERESIHAGS